MHFNFPRDTNCCTPYYSRYIQQLLYFCTCASINASPLLTKGDLCKHAVSEGTKAILKYHQSAQAENAASDEEENESKTNVAPPSGFTFNLPHSFAPQEEGGGFTIVPPSIEAEGKVPEPNEEVGHSAQKDSSSSPSSSPAKSIPCEICGQVFSSAHGVAIHKGRMHKESN